MTPHTANCAPHTAPAHDAPLTPTPAAPRRSGARKNIPALLTDAGKRRYLHAFVFERRAGRARNRSFDVIRTHSAISFACNWWWRIDSFGRGCGLGA